MSHVHSLDFHFQFGHGKQVSPEKDFPLCVVSQAGSYKKGLICMQCQAKSMGKVASIVITKTEAKPELWGSREEDEAISNVVQEVIIT